MLDEIRIGICSSKTIDILKKCQLNLLKYDDDILPTVLYSTNIEVDNLNKQNLKELPGEGNKKKIINSNFISRNKILFNR